MDLCIFDFSQIYRFYWVYSDFFPSNSSQSELSCQSYKIAQVEYISFVIMHTIVSALSCYMIQIDDFMMVTCLIVIFLCSMYAGNAYDCIESTILHSIYYEIEQGVR